MIVFCFISQEEMKMCSYDNVLLFVVLVSEGIVKFSLEKDFAVLNS
jgi:hypothetical protein